MLSTIQAPLPPVSAPLSPPPPPAAAVLVFCVTLNFKVRIVVPHQWGVDETTASGVARLIRQIIRHFPKCRKEMICLPGNPNVQTQPGPVKKSLLLSKLTVFSGSNVLRGWQCGS